MAVWPPADYLNPPLPPFAKGGLGGFGFYSLRYPKFDMQKIKWGINKLYRGLRLYSSARSYKTWGLLLKHLYRHCLGEGVPDLLTIGLTYRCQCNCVHCSSNVPNRRNTLELKTGQVKAIIDQAIKLGFIRVTFFGGEPLIREDIVELIHYASRRGMITRVNTNGWLLSRELIARLKGAGLSLCDVSIDDPDPHKHDALRGLPGLYEKAVEGIRLLKEYDILCQIVTYASKRNITSGLEQIIHLGKELRAFAVSIVFPMATGCWYDSFDVLLSEDEKERVRSLGDSSFVHVELPSPHSRCSVAKKSALYISPEGDATPCPFIPYALGNVKEENCGDIWQKYSSGAKLNFAGDCPMNSPENREGLKSAIGLVNKEIKILHPKPVWGEMKGQEPQKGDERKPRELSF
jgi:MoaA/NifB/PqqE/SkfB family radical SAM enzyme